ncbi:MAG: ABC transporter substrate-binding protein [Nocardioides sp.]
MSDPITSYRRGTLAASALVVAIALMGCGLNTESPESSPGATRTTIKVATLEPVGNLNPWMFGGQFHAMDAIYDPLVAYGPGGEFQPALAESWEIAADGLSVTFKLREGVTFHDGTDFDAEAVKWNFEQWVGKEDYSWLGTSTVVEKITTSDARTVTLELSRPYPPLVQELTVVRPVRFVSPSSAADGAYADPIGTGPWKFESADDTGGVFVRNEDYWGTKPSLERLEFKTIPDSQTRLTALRSGEVDLIGGGYLSPISTVEAQQLAEDDSVQLLTGEADTAVALTFNTRGPLAEKAVREALSLATDTATLNQVMYGGSGNVATRYFPPSVPHSGTPFERPNDLDEARAVLDAAGWKIDGEDRIKDGKPLKLEMLLASDPQHGMIDSRATGVALQDTWAKAGFELDIRTVDGASYFDEEAKRDWDVVFSVTYGAPYDPTNTAMTFLSSTSDVAVWTSPELDALLDIAVSASEPGELDSAYQAVYDYLESEVAFIPITYPARHYAVGPKVRGFQIPPHEYRLDLSGVTIEE